MNYPRVPRTMAVVLVLLFLPMLPACRHGDRPPLGRVTGTVTLDGQALAGASVVFQPQGARTSRGITDEAGRYELIYLRDIHGAVLGDHRVRIVTADEENTEERLPARYNRETTLGAKVKPGKNSFDFKLHSD